MEIEDLSNQVNDLKLELENVRFQNQKAAQYGLQVLEEKNILSQKIEQLEKDHYFLQTEFDLSTKALHNNKSKTKIAFCEGELRETDLDKQRRDAEEKLATVEREKEMEVYQLQTMLKSSNSEIERLTTLNNELNLTNQALDHQRMSFKKELKELRITQAYLDSACSELEEENCSLQKQVSHLKETQVEYEGLKYEVKSLNEEVEFLNSQLEETLRLKDMLERQVDDAHETVQKEREIKLGLKRELAQYDNIDLTGITIPNHLHLDENINDQATSKDDSDLEHPLIRHITSDLIHAGRISENGNDLYSELNFSEISKLKQQICTMEKEKIALINNLREQQTQIENKERENDQQCEKDSDALVQVKSLQDKLDEAKSKERERKDNNKKLDSALKEALEGKKHLQAEIDRLAASLTQHNHEAKISNEQVQIVSDQISQLYHRLCLSNGEIPKPLVLGMDEMKNREEREDGNCPGGGDNNGVATDDHHGDDDEGEEETLSNPLHTVLKAMRKQMEWLETTIDTMAKENPNNTSWSATDAHTHAESQETQEQMVALEDEVLRLKSLLSSKREQIATLRRVLETNKHSAEVR